MISRVSTTLSLCGLLSALALAGCGGASNFPDVNTESAPAQVRPMASIQGSNYGGHAPIVGGKVFVLEANPSATGYGQLVKSLLTSSSANPSFPTAQDTTQGSPTNGMYYVTTSSSGQFFLTGDYTCDIGYPVYLYAQGGNPNAPSQAQSTITLTGASSSVTTPGYNGYLVVTFSTTGVQLLYQGEQVTFGSGIGGGYSAFNGTTQTVASVNLTTNQFSVVLGPAGSALGPATFTSTVTQAGVANNPGIVNMALLGVCGDTSPTNPTPTSTANFTNLNFVFMNEVSTAATAYALGGFFQTPSYTYTINVGSLTHNGVTVQPGVQNNLGHLTATGSSTGTVTITGAVISNSGYTITMTASGPVSAGDTLTYSSPDSNGSFGNYLSGAMGTPSTVYTTSDAMHLSVPSGDAQALTGLKNAARNAAILFDIQGSNVGTGTDGDTHIARSTTPNAAAGTVPQALLDTVGNLLANCVDSANQYGVNATTATESPQCATLFNTATSTGASGGVTPYDTATAAINIAHYPGGSGSSSSFASTLYNSISGNVPFVPNLSSPPHDFAVGVTYQTPATAISDIAVDASGDVWTVGTSSNDVLELSPSGTYSTYTPPSGTTIGNPLPNSGYTTGITIDPSGTVYASALLGTVKFTPGTPTGTVFGTANTANGGQLAADSAGNLYIADYAVANSNLATYYEPLGINNPLANSDLVKESTSGTAAGGNFPIGPGLANATQNSAAGCIPAVSYLALDSNNNIWTSTPNNTYQPYASVCRFSSTGVLQYSFAVTPGSNLGLPHQIAVDSGNNAWFAEKDQSYVYKIAAGSTTANSGTTLATGGTLSAPKGVAIDGANTVWVSNTGTTNGTLVRYNNAATAITPSYLSGTGYGGNSYLYLSVDQAGNVWAVDNSDGILVQYIGVGSPVAQPFSVARAGVGLGAKP